MPVIALPFPVLRADSGSTFDLVCGRCRRCRR